MRKYQTLRGSAKNTKNYEKIKYIYIKEYKKHEEPPKKHKGKSTKNDKGIRKKT